jgi:O-antigen/teichoic acid export membrane protein
LRRLQLNKHDRSIGVAALTRNTIANFVGQGYTTLVGLVMLPLYLKFLGAEAFGLVGFFAVLQAWLALLDMGLTPTLTRELARHRGQNGDIKELWSLLHTIEWVFASLALLIATGAVLVSHWLAQQWLSAQTLDTETVAYCVAIMGAIIGLRWFSALYRGGVQGLEQMVWLNGANIVLATIRFFGAYIVLRWVSASPTHFFEFQLFVSLLEAIVLAFGLYSKLPATTNDVALFNWNSLRRVLPFASGMAYTSALWILLTQADKLLLSYTLSLREFGYFSLAAVVANGMLSLSLPVSQAILPRMTMLLSERNETAMIELYRKATRLVAAVIFPLTGAIAMSSRDVLYFWTGDREAAVWAGPVLTWFVLGNGILMLSAFPYFLQFVHGRLRLHVINSSVTVVVQIPVLAYAAIQYGALGVAYAWFALRIAAFLIFPAVVHRHFAPGLHIKWLVIDVLPLIATSWLVLGASKWIGDVIGINEVAMLVMVAAALAVTSLMNGLLFVIFRHLKWV